MSGTGGEEAPRPRPLSGGLWTLFSWLRRDERSSSDSLSSAGSDRTAISFSFLPPVNYKKVKPLIVPPPGPPTDSYRKRVQERNLRRQHDRNTTLHRKYGLYRSDCQSGYDAFSLPPARRTGSEQNSKWDRERRATSECFQSRAVHVPGKRRAPLPPTRISSVEPTTTLTRRTRKRPAPPPPVRLFPKIEEDKQHLNKGKVVEMNPQTSQSQQLSKNSDVSMECKPKKYSKKDNNGKESKSWTEKNFLKQIFENKKRNSTADEATVKVLPSISELDKQAVEIIKTSNKNTTDKNDKVTSFNISIVKSQGSNGHSKGDYWFCIVCLRKYDSSIADCLYCLHKHKSPCISNNIQNSATTYTQIDDGLSEKLSSHNITQERKVEDKQKLREMLKEMKDSLPKRPKDGEIEMEKSNNKNTVTEAGEKNNHVFETPTLRLGTAVNLENTKQPSEANILEKEKSLFPEIKSSLINNVLITQQVVIEPSCSKSVKECTSNTKTTASKSNSNRIAESEDIKINTTSSNIIDEKFNTPLKVSSLLNPIYIPKDNNKVASTTPPVIILNSKLNNVVVNNTKTEESVELRSKPHAILTTIVPSTVQTLQDNLKTNKFSLNNEPNFAIDINVGSKATLETTREEPSKKASREKCESKEKKVTHIPNKETSVAKTPLNTQMLNESKITNNSDLNSTEETNIMMPSTDRNGKTDRAAESMKRQAKQIALPKNILEVIPTSPSNASSKDHHSQRRSLITQLEQSIAKGDERAAAEAAAKLAQLRLSCSVLSFSSQIVSEPKISRGEKYKSSLVMNDVTAKHISSQVKKNNNIEPPTPAAQNALQLSSISSKSTSAKSVESIQSSISEPSTSKQPSDIVSLKVWVEDREAARGPIHLHVPRQATLGNLRNEAEASLGLARHLQRWIVGKTLCVDNDTVLENVAGVDFNAPIYLCLVESEIFKGKVQEKTRDFTEEIKENRAEGLANVYTELVQLEQQALVPSPEEFECGVCMEESDPGAGVVLRDCVHTFCKQCLSHLVLHCEEPVISCPAMGCRGILEEREIRALVSPEEYDRWLARGLNAAESGTRNAFHCRTRDCTGWALCEPGVRKFPCPVCKHTNCVPCKAIHEGQTCEEFKLKEAANSGQKSETDDSTRALLDTLLRRGEALECPECEAIITKKWGCDWIKCSACKTEICWVTRGRRWGPAGRGDTSAGCRCGVDGKRCHPSCGYCH